jgi:hypothetical protein
MRINLTHDLASFMHIIATQLFSKTRLGHGKSITYPTAVTEAFKLPCFGRFATALEYVISRLTSDINVPVAFRQEW